MNKVVTIKQTACLPVSPEKVYETFIDPEKHSEFTGSKASGKPKVGGKFETWDGYSFGKYLELEKDRRIVQTWQTTDWPEGYPPSKLEILLKRTDEGTELTMIQTDVPAEIEEELAEGWLEFYWKPMKKYFKNIR